MLDIEVHRMRNFSKKYRKKYLKGMDILKEAINTDEFKYRVCHFQYQHDGIIYKGFKRPYVNGIHLSPPEIYALLTSGKDQFNKEADQDIDIDVTLYHKRWAGVIGYTNTKTWRTWINKRFLKRSSFSPENIASNSCHEYCHNVGFRHDKKWNPTRQFTVPYAVGKIIRDIAFDLKENNLMTTREGVNGENKSSDGSF